MDKYHYVLNALLDEMDLLRREQQEALGPDADYDYASWLQTAQFVTSGHLRYMRSIFQESSPGCYHVREVSPTGAFDKHLAELLNRQNPVTELRLVFEKDRLRYEERHIEFIKFSVNKPTLDCTLVHFIDVNRFYGSDSGYGWWQRKQLSLIGWGEDNPDVEQYSVQFPLQQKNLKERVKECVARTVLEALDLYEKSTKLIVKQEA